MDSRPTGEAAGSLREVFQRRSLSTLFQPIYGFREARVLGFEALVRGPRGSLVETPFELFGAAQREGLVVELNIVCIQEILRAFARCEREGTLFLNISPQLIVQRGFDQARAARFLDALGLRPERVVIELTEDYPTFDFRLVRESLMLYRAMGFRVAIDDLGEGFSSLRLWSELKPEFVKADKHFVTGIARDAVKLQFLRAIQHIAEASGALVIAEGIETPDDFKVVRDLGIAYGQGFFIGRPDPAPSEAITEWVAAAQGDTRVRVAPMPRRRAGRLRAQDFVRSVDAAGPSQTLGTLWDRFARSPGVGAIPVAGRDGVEGVLSRGTLEAIRATAKGRWHDTPCGRHMDPSPIRVEADLDIDALVAMLLEADPRRLADGFVIVSRARYLGMGRSQDVLRALQQAQALAARHSHPLTLLPGAVPLNEHLERLLARPLPFTAWVAQIEEMAGLNDAQGFGRGDALIHATARVFEAACEPDIDVVGHVSGTRFFVLMQSDDWRDRAGRVLDEFAKRLEAHASCESCERGYFTVERREGPRVRPLPRLAIGILPVLPGVFESRHDVWAEAKAAKARAARAGASALHVDERHANAYPASYLFEPG